MSSKKRDLTTDQFTRISTSQSESETSSATDWKPGRMTNEVSESKSSNSMKAAQLRIMKLEWQLNLTRMTASNSQQTRIQLIHNKVTEFKQELAFKSLTIIFKLEESSNYDIWQDKALIQTLAIKAKNILQNFKKTCSDSTTNPEDRWIWKIKNETIFNILLDELKSTVRQIIKSWIDENKKNAAELWQMLKTEYRIHVVDKWFELLCKFTFILMNTYNNDVQMFISDFRKICNKLKMMKYNLSD